jgi:hypothetical protein
MHSTSSIILDLEPCAIEFSPRNPEYFVVGTYHLEVPETGPSPRTRRGSLILFHVKDEQVYV